MLRNWVLTVLTDTNCDSAINRRELVPSSASRTDCSRRLSRTTTGRTGWIWPRPASVSGGAVGLTIGGGCLLEIVAHPQVGQALGDDDGQLAGRCRPQRPRPAEDRPHRTPQPLSADYLLQGRAHSSVRCRGTPDGKVRDRARGSQVDRGVTGSAGLRCSGAPVGIGTPPRLRRRYQPSYRRTGWPPRREWAIYP